MDGTSGPFGKRMAGGSGTCGGVFFADKHPKVFSFIGGVIICLPFLAVLVPVYPVIPGRLCGDMNISHVLSVRNNPEIRAKII